MDREDSPVAVEIGEPTDTTWTPTEQEAVPSTEECDAEVTAQVSEDEAAVSDPDAATTPQIIEALLFGSDTPLTAQRLSELSNCGSVRAVRRHIAALNEKYAACGLTFTIEEIAKGYRLLTRPVYDPWLRALHQQRTQTRLTGAAMETLSIVAYKQPVIRADVEAIRGVACGEVLNRLREMGLVKIVGRAEIVGRPLLYGTTKKFLDVFGLADLDDLPPMEALSFRKAEEPEAAVDDNRDAEATEPEAAADTTPTAEAV